MTHDAPHAGRGDPSPPRRPGPNPMDAAEVVSARGGTLARTVHTGFADVGSEA